MYIWTSSKFSYVAIKYAINLSVFYTFRFFVVVKIFFNFLKFNRHFDAIKMIYL